MNLGEFHTQISAEVNKGTRLDAYIPGYVRRAARVLERNYSLFYMEKFGLVEVDTSADNARFVEFPSSRVKKVDFVRLIGQGTDVNTFKYLYPVQARNVLTKEQTLPNGYWLVGGGDLSAGYLVLDQVGTTNFSLELKYVEYTLWPNADSATPWLLQHAEDVMIGLTMELLAPIAREDSWVQRYKPMFDLGIKTLLDADEEMRSAGDPAGFQMVYG